MTEAIFGQMQQLYENQGLRVRIVKEPGPENRHVKSDLSPFLFAPRNSLTIRAAAIES